MYQTLSRHGSVDADVQLLLNVLAYADGQHDTPTMAQLFNIPESKVSEAVDALLKAGLIIDS
jgi:aminopeptidase-like protein